MRSFLGIVPRTVKLYDERRALPLHSKNPQYTFREPFDGKSERDRYAKNHTKGAFLLWSYVFVTFSRREQCLYYAFSASQSLRHAPRATSLYTREAQSEPIICLKWCSHRLSGKLPFLYEGGEGLGGSFQALRGVEHEVVVLRIPPTLARKVAVVPRARLVRMAQVALCLL